MIEDHFPLILDLVEWVDKKPRLYADVMDAWRTSCPRLPVWEDAVDAGYIEHQHRASGGTLITITHKGQQLLVQNERLNPCFPATHESIPTQEIP